MQDLAVARERSSEHDEPVVDEGVHEPRVLIPVVLLTQTA